MLTKADIKLGNKVRCISDSGWDSFEEGGVYTMTELWNVLLGVTLDGIPVSGIFFADFELVEEA